jgi:transcriptional regulator with XRE-family HTH domain
MMTVGQDIYRRRIEAGITQLELVRRTGIPQPNLSNIEKGKQDMTVSTLIQIAWALGVKPGELLESQVGPRQKPFPLTRELVEKIAKALFDDRTPLSPAEQTVVSCLKQIIPGIGPRRKSAKEINRAWFQLRRWFREDEIRFLVERVEGRRP